jgi:RNA polymerase sigma factor (sigma-70 family)
MLIPLTDLSELNALSAGERREEAWEAFHARYRGVIFSWCRRRELPPDLAEDLTQEVLLKLFQQLPRHAYDPAKGPFRNWLKGLVNNVVTDHWRRQQRRPDRGVFDSACLEALTSPEATDELGDALEQRARTTAEEVFRRVRARVEERTWQAFYQKKVEERPAAEVAAALGLSVGGVYQAAQRVKTMLLEEYHHVDPTRRPPPALPGGDDPVAVPE